MAFPGFEPESDAFYAGDAAAVFRRLRAEDPLHWHEPGRFWALTRHADVLHVSQRPRRYSSERGTQLFEVVRLAHGERPFGADAKQLAGGADTIIRMDPPRHNRHRKLVIGAFTPRRVAALEPRVREIAKRSLDVLDPSRPIEFVEQVAVPLPMFVIAELLGVPAEDHADFRRWSDAMVEAGGGRITERTATAGAELVRYVLRVADERRRRPQDDVISLLVRAEVDGERLSDPEIGMFCLTLLVAGNETTRNLIAGGALALARHPEQRERLLADPGLLPNAVDEMLRFVSPVRSFARTSTEDATLHGREIRAGDALVLFYGSANRDEEVFGADAERFDVARESAPRHVAFGFGEHFCLGASLARLEARAMFEELLARWPRFALAAEPEPLPSSLMNGLVRMPVELAP